MTCDSNDDGAVDTCETDIENRSYACDVVMKFNFFSGFSFKQNSSFTEYFLQQNGRSKFVQADRAIQYGRYMNSLSVDL